MKKIILNSYIKYGILVLAGIFAGWLLFHGSDHKMDGQKPATEANAEEIWTCAMHPQVRMHEPGKCPICGMDLILQKQQVVSDSSTEGLQLSAEAAALAGVTTSFVTRQKPVKELQLTGQVEFDERTFQNQVAHIQGRIEGLNLNFTGEYVSAGEVLGQIYSPDLVTAQQELLQAASARKEHPELYEASRTRLRQWMLTDKQIDEIEQTGKIRYSTDIISNTSGVVVSKKVNKGDYVEKGSILFEIADPSNIWIQFDAYETDLPFLKKGTAIDFSIEALPGEQFHGTVSFIDPVIDRVTRISKVRVETKNTGGRIKPGMFATGTVNSVPAGYENSIVVPKSSVLWTGKRSVVYVKSSSPGGAEYTMREIVLGPELREGYIVENGLREGEEIVTNGTFTIDAAAQLHGKQSMMNSDLGSPKNSGQVTNNTQHGVFRVSGNCDMCKDRIEKTALSVKGVETASWDAGTGKLTVDYNSDSASPDLILQAITTAGHDNERFRAADEVYNSLPSCCHYRK